MTIEAKEMLPLDEPAHRTWFDGVAVLKRIEKMLPLVAWDGGAERKVIGASMRMVGDLFVVFVQLEHDEDLDGPEECGGSERLACDISVPAVVRG